MRLPRRRDYTISELRKAGVASLEQTYGPLFYAETTAPDSQGAWVLRLRSKHDGSQMMAFVCCPDEMSSERVDTLRQVERATYPIPHYQVGRFYYSVLRDYAKRFIR